MEVISKNLKQIFIPEVKIDVDLGIIIYGGFVVGHIAHEKNGVTIHIELLNLRKMNSHGYLSDVGEHYNIKNLFSEELMIPNDTVFMPIGKGLYCSIGTVSALTADLIIPYKVNMNI